MEFRKVGDKYIIRLEKGEELVATLKDFCTAQGIKLGYINGIGAVGKATIGLFETGTKTYHSTELVGDHEISGLMGNITTMKGETYLHLHACLSNAKYETLGGHLNSAVVSATAEIVIQAMDGEVDRAFSDEIGLNLLKF